MARRNIVGPQIRRLRYNRGWSQSDLAAKLQMVGLDISRCGLAKIESQLVYVTDYELFYFMKVFQVRFLDLFPKIEMDGAVYESILGLLNGPRRTMPNPQGKKNSIATPLNAFPD